MPKTTPEQNKVLVLEAFDTVFNKRAYATVERFCSSQSTLTKTTEAPQPGFGNGVPE